MTVQKLLGILGLAGRAGRRSGLSVLWMSCSRSNCAAATERARRCEPLEQD